MLDEIYRVLTAKGIYICITYGTHQYRMPYLDKVKKRINLKYILGSIWLEYNRIYYI